MKYMFKKPIKIDFPEEEYLSLMGRDIIVTHRVSDEFSLYMQGDYIRVPWRHIYKCIYRMNIYDIKDSPCYDKLTPAQVRELSKYDNIAVIYLRRNQERHIDNRGIEHLYEEAINDYMKYLNIRINNIKLKISEVPTYTEGKPAPKWIGLSAGNLVRKTRSIIINPYPEIPMRAYNVKGWDNKRKVAEFVYLVCAHELTHAVDAFNMVSRKDIEDCIRDAKEEGFTTEYLQSYGKDVPDEEIYAERMAYTLVNICKNEGKKIFEFLVK